MLGRHHACVAHHLPGFLEPTEAAEFGRECDGRYFCYTAQRLQRVHDRSPLLGRDCDGLIDRRIEALNALALVVDLENQLKQCCILLGVWKPQCSNPLPPRRCPRVAVVSGSLPVAQKIFEESLLRAQLILLCRFSRSNQVAQCFMLRIRNPYRRQIPGLVRPRMSFSVTASSLDLITGLHRN